MDLQPYLRARKDSGSAAEVDEFALPTKARQLVERILQDLILPCRRRLEHPQRQFAAAIQAAEQIFKFQETQFLSACQEEQNKYHCLHEQLNNLIRTSVEIYQSAEKHLQNYGLVSKLESVNPESTPPILERGGPYEAHLIDSFRAEIQQSIQQLENFYRTSRPEFWPKSFAARLSILIGSTLLFLTTPLLLFIWPAMILALRPLAEASMQKKGQDLLNRCSRLKLELIAVKRQAHTILDQETADIRARLRLPAEIKRDEAITKAEQELRAEIERIAGSLKPVAAALHEESGRLWKDSGYAAKPWNSPEWQKWQPDESPQFAASLGTWRISAADLQAKIPGLDFEYRLPALIPFQEGKCLLLDGASSTEGPAKTMQAATLRVLATTPPGKARFTLIDPVGLGHNVAEYMLLRDYNQELIGGKAWSEPHHIEQQLSKLTEEMEVVIQTYLRKDHATIRDYNCEHPEVAEPFRFLIIFDFPVNFTESAARRLASIVKNGPRCGVHTFILRNSTKKLTGFDDRELTQFGWPVGELANHVVLEPDGLPPPELAKTIIGRSGEVAAAGMKRAVPFRKLVAATLREDAWKLNSTSELLRVPLGPAGIGKPQELILGSGQEAHVLLVGRTGSGKTNLMHVIIVNLALNYSPIELQLFLIDFKGGVGFKRYADHHLPHAKVIAIESEREFGLSVLQGLGAEIKRRDEAFKAGGVDNLAAYRAKFLGANTFPRILLVVDEFQEFFTENDDIALQAKIILERLARQGRSYGIHFLLATQSLSGSAQLPAAIMGQIKVRIALPCSESDSRLILADDNKAARGLSQAGEGIYNPMGGSVEGNQRFQVALFDEQHDLAEYLGTVAALSHASGIDTVPIIFEGNELARLEECEPLKSLLRGPSAPGRKGAILFLGEPIGLQPPVAARLRRQSGSNLMILTRDEREGVGMCLASLISILAQQTPGSSRIYIADFTTADSDWANIAEGLAQAIPAAEIAVVGQQRQFGPLLATVAEDLERMRESSTTKSGGEIYLIIQGMHRIRDLRGGSDDRTSELATESFRTILRDGPEVGVYVIAWADCLDSAVRGIGRGGLRDFGLRVGSVMSAVDSSTFLDGPAASKIIKPHRAIYFEEDRPGQLLTFRPYSLPSDAWLEETCLRIANRLVAAT